MSARKANCLSTIGPEPAHDWQTSGGLNQGFPIVWGDSRRPWRHGGTSLAGPAQAATVMGTEKHSGAPIREKVQKCCIFRDRCELFCPARRHQPGTQHASAATDLPAGNAPPDPVECGPA